MRRPTVRRYVQRYESYMDYSDYPEGAKRHRLVSQKELAPGDPAPEGVRASCMEGGIDRWIYYRVYPT